MPDLSELLRQALSRPVPLGWVALALLAALWFAARAAWARGRVGRGNRRRGRRARRAERDAEALLVGAGYRILDRQLVADWELEVDGRPTPARVRADLLVERDGRTFIAEIKSGEAVRAAAPATRRQLLEYLLVFEVDGVLLVDMEARRVRAVEFPSLL